MADCQLKHGRLFYRNRMYISDYPKLCLHLIQQAYSSPSGGYSGKSRIFEILSRYYFCLSLAQLVHRFMWNSKKYSRLQASNEKYNWLFHLLPVPLEAWKEVALDFITWLPQVEDYNVICIIINRLTKQRLYIPYTNTIDGRGTAKLCYFNIYRLHGLSHFITSDCSSQFVNEFWSRLISLIGVALCLFTIYHPETDGQTEIANKWME